MAMPKSTEATMARCLDDLSHGNGLAVWVLLNATHRRALVMGWLILNAPDELVERAGEDRHVCPRGSLLSLILESFGGGGRGVVS